ncbi:MAG: LPS export ABC transporter periplasmic protein LptC [Gammaproteobacteria bacterium]|nr:LPS export ABC transporter periplasmic protein LptC [Gammaproteobacteria bacterium]
MNRSSALSYALVTLVIAVSAFIFWQVNGDTGRTVNQAVNPEHHDAYIIGAHYHSTDKSGNLHERLHVNSAKHYPYQNTSELHEPELDIFGPHGEMWHIHATKGTSTQGSDTVILYDKVQIEHRVRSSAPAVVVTTDKLTVHPNLKTADSDSVVTINYPQIVLRGKGLHGDMKAGTLKLLTDIRGQYEPIARTAQPSDNTHAKLRTPL